MPIARPLLKYDRLKTRITTPGGGVSATRITGVLALAWHVARLWPFAGLCLGAV